MWADDVLAVAIVTSFAAAMLAIAVVLMGYGY
jgi:hypothetical protein